MNQHIPLSNIINKLQRKELLLKLEYDYEKETFRQQTEAMGIGRKVKRGMCWYPISPRSFLPRRTHDRQRNLFSGVSMVHGRNGSCGKWSGNGL